MIAANNVKGNLYKPILPQTPQRYQVHKLIAYYFLENPNNYEDVIPFDMDNKNNNVEKI